MNIHLIYPKQASPTIKLLSVKEPFSQAFFLIRLSAETNHLCQMWCLGCLHKTYFVKIGGAHSNVTLFTHEPPFQARASYIMMESDSHVMAVWQPTWNVLMVIFSPQLILLLLRVSAEEPEWTLRLIDTFRCRSPRSALRHMSKTTSGSKHYSYSSSTSAGDKQSVGFHFYQSNTFQQR